MREACLTYGLPGRFEPFGTHRTAKPGYLNQTRMSDDPICKSEFTKLEFQRRKRGLCPTDGYPLKVRHIEHEAVTLVCPKCKVESVFPRSHRLYMRAIEVMEREVKA
jgi:hypothetical protein